jgi:hypothetical protein
MDWDESAFVEINRQAGGGGEVVAHRRQSWAALMCSRISVPSAYWTTG